MEDEFTRAVREMRDAQKQYFKTKNTVYLQLSKEWEKKVDSMVLERTKPDTTVQPVQGTLFG